jgi:hypothetical protein
MTAEEAHELIGRCVVDADGRRLGCIVGITHHWHGGSSGLVSFRSWLRRRGLHVSLERAVLVDGTVRLGYRPRPALQLHMPRRLRGFRMPLDVLTMLILAVLTVMSFAYLAALTRL